MPPPRTTVAPEAILAALDAHGGCKTAAACQLGMHRDTLRKLMTEYGISEKPLVAGRLRQLAPNVLPLPPKGKISRYLLTAAQNNTWVHNAFLENLKAYAKQYDARLMVSRMTYNKTAFNNVYYAKPGRKPTASDHGEAWYDSRITPFVCDDPEQHGSCKWQLAPDLFWCTEANILPTSPNPLSGRHTYAGMASAIFPHTRAVMDSCARLKGQKPRFVYTTGAVTQLNYIQRNEGQKAEFHHVYGAMIVEVNSDGDWWARQINADSAGMFYDCPGGQVIKVTKGKVTRVKGKNHVAGMNWGDVHASEIDPEVSDVNWAPEGAMDCLRPRAQFMNDLFSMRSQNHHERNQFGTRYKRWLNKENVVEEEINQTRDLLHKAHRPWCKTVVVNSNHDRHGEKWLDEADYKSDFPNVEFFLRAQLARVMAMKDGGRLDVDWYFLEWAIRRAEHPPLTFLGMDDSYIIGPRNHPVECGLHGDKGPNGARGSTRNLATLGMRSNKGHDHTATIFEGTWSAGTCGDNMAYNHGPTKWSYSHIVTYLNGKRAMLTQRAGRLWA